jgi:pyruvate carboxylase
MSQPSSRIQESLLVALRHMQTSPHLNPDEVEWLNRYAARLIAEFSVHKSETESPSPSGTIAA